MTPFQIIQGAINATNKYGWYCGPGNSVGTDLPQGGCMMEVLAIGAGHKPQDWSFPAWYKACTVSPDYYTAAERKRAAKPDNVAWTAAAQAVLDVLIERGEVLEGADYLDHIARWNDAICTSQDHALDVLKAALRKVIPSPVEILAKAADTLENGRWCKGAWLDEKGAKCLDGAIESAARELLLGKPYQQERCVVTDEDGLSYDIRLDVGDKLADARKLVRDQVNADYGTFDFIAWNDRQKDKRKVIRLMRRVVRNAS